MALLVEVGPKCGIHSGSIIRQVRVNRKMSLQLSTKISRRLVTVLSLVCGAIWQVAMATTALPGAIDSTFGVDGVRYAGFSPHYANSGAAIAVQSDGKIVVAGSCGRPGPVEWWTLDWLWEPCYLRLNQNGSLDLTFGVNGRFIHAQPYHTRSIALAIDRSDSIYALEDGGANPGTLGVDGACVRRLTSSGALDNTFGVNGAACGLGWPALGKFDSPRALILTSTDAQVLVAGGCNGSGWPLETNSDFCMVRLTADGREDPGFGVGGLASVSRTETHDVANAIALRPDGGTVLVGSCEIERRNPARGTICGVGFTADGKVDVGFGVGGRFDIAPTQNRNEGHSIAVLGGGGLLVGGRCSVGSLPATATCLSKVLSDGRVDQTFGTGGSIVFWDGEVHSLGSLVAQGDNKFLVAGQCANGPCVRRFLRNGAIDQQFGNGGIASMGARSSRYVWYPRVALALDLRGDMLITAACDTETFDSRNRGSDMCVARFKRGPYDASTCTLNADLNNQVAGNDGVLTIRYLLGFTANALTDGALGANPGRTAQQIEAHLAQLKTDGKLDVDGDGEANAMTDGLLILRAMLGLSGEALIAGARNASHPNVRDARQILTWIEATHGVACLP